MLIFPIFKNFLLFIHNLIEDIFIQQILSLEIEITYLNICFYGLTLFSEHSSKYFKFSVISQITLWLPVANDEHILNL